MGAPRLPKSLSDKEKWDRICKKIPQIIKLIDNLLPSIDSFLNAVKAQFRYPDRTIEFLKMEGMPDWSGYYTDPSPMFKLFSLLLNSGGMKEQLHFSGDKVLQVGEISAFLQKVIAVPNGIDEKKIESSFKDSTLMKEFILLYFTGLIDFACLLKFGEAMHQLITKAKNGDDSALFKVIQMDKALLTSEWVGKRIREAFLFADQSFFKGLSRSLAKPSIDIINLPGLRLSIFLSFFWPLGLCKLNDPELSEVIKKYDLYTIRDIETLRKFRNRLGLKKGVMTKISWDNL